VISVIFTWVILGVWESFQGIKMNIFMIYTLISYIALGVCLVWF